MAIEQLLTDLISAINANTAALNGSGGGAKTGETTTATAVATGKAGKAAKTTKATEDKPEHNQDEVNAALIKLKDDFGIEHARAILKKHKYEKMGEIKPENFDVIFAEAETLHAELSAKADDSGDDSGDGL